MSHIPSGFRYHASPYGAPGIKRSKQSAAPNESIAAAADAAPMEVEQELPPASSHALRQTMKEILGQAHLLWNMPGWTRIEALSHVVEALTVALAGLEAKGAEATDASRTECDRLFQAVVPLCQSASRVLASAAAADAQSGISSQFVANKLELIAESHAAWSAAVATQQRQAQRNAAATQAEAAIPSWDSYPGFTWEAIQSLQATMNIMSSFERHFEGRPIWADFTAIAQKVELLGAGLCRQIDADHAGSSDETLVDCAEDCAWVTMQCKRASQALRAEAANADMDPHLVADFVNRLDSLANSLAGWAAGIAQELVMTREP